MTHIEGFIGTLEECLEVLQGRKMTDQYDANKPVASLRYKVPGLFGDEEVVATCNFRYIDIMALYMATRLAKENEELHKQFRAGRPGLDEEDVKIIFSALEAVIARVAEGAKP